MLRLWIVNVGHGDSIVLEHDGPSGRFFGLIDSNRESRTAEPRALKILRERGATELSFVLLTHPHADHFRGLHSILESLPVKTLYIYPVYSDFARLKKQGQLYLDAAERGDSETIKCDAEEFVRLVLLAHKLATTNQLQLTSLVGPTARVRPQGFEKVTINALLPFARYKGEFYNALDGNRGDALQSPKQNELSVAIDIQYESHSIALCADATRSAWMDHEKELAKSNERPAFDVVKLPHHGSASDCDAKVLDYLFRRPAGPAAQIALISAPGSRHHPSPEVLRALRGRSILPYCTNLSTVCGNNVRHMVTSTEVSPEIIKLLNVQGALPKNERRQPCQGDICIEMAQDGQVAIKREFQHPCQFRGDLDFLGSM